MKFHVLINPFSRFLALAFGLASALSIMADEAGAIGGCRPSNSEGPQVNIFEPPILHDRLMDFGRQDILGEDSLLYPSNQPPIIPRSSWIKVSDKPKKEWPKDFMKNLKGMTIHYAAGYPINIFETGKDRANAVYEEHAIKNNWGDIGYNFLVDKQGNIYEGRTGSIEDAVIGGHAIGFNRETMGVCGLLRRWENPTDSMLDSIAKVITWKLKKHNTSPFGTIAMNGLTVQVIHGHRELLTSEECPGDPLFNKLGTVREKAQNCFLPKKIVIPMEGEYIYVDGEGCKMYGDNYNKNGHIMVAIGSFMPAIFGKAEPLGYSSLEETDRYRVRAYDPTRQWYCDFDTNKSTIFRQKCSYVDLLNDRFDMEVTPDINAEQQRVYVPVRGIAYLCDYNIEWDGINKAAIMTKR